MNNFEKSEVTLYINAWGSFHHTALVHSWIFFTLIYLLSQRLKVVGSIPVETIRIFNWPNPSSRTMSLGSTQPLTEMSTRNLPGRGGGGKERPARKADNLTAICEASV
jgi:hypothetical protein